MALGRHLWVIARTWCVAAACLTFAGPACAQGVAQMFAPPPLVASLPSANPDQAESDDSVPDNSAADDKDGKDDKQERLGEEPPTTTIDLFRQSNVLLPEGMLEVEWGFSYTLFEDNFLTILPDSSLAPLLTSSRTMLGSLS